MNPKEKAIEFYNKFYNTLLHNHSVTIRKYLAKKNALIAVDEILESHYKVFTGVNSTIYIYYQKIKQEIEKL